MEPAWLFSILNHRLRDLRRVRNRVQLLERVFSVHGGWDRDLSVLNNDWVHFLASLNFLEPKSGYFVLFL
jgi:hypothetical protein